ncbi:MAG: metal ABC transporter substrate-binding protein [Thermacetogeniaceae bacterium]
MLPGRRWGFKAVVVLLTLALLLGAFVTGCQRLGGSASQETAKEGRITVVATIPPLADYAKMVGGKRVRVLQLLPLGAEPHDWEPSPREIESLYKARLVVYNGAGLEPWMERLLPSLRSRGVRALEASEGLDLLTYAEEEREGWTVFIAAPEKLQRERIVDPHVWLDPVLAQDIVSRLARELIAIDPAGETEYLRNAKSLKKRLAELDSAYADAVRSFKRKEIVVSHAAFGYLARRYGLRQVPILGLAPEQEPDAAAFSRAVDYCRKRGVKCVFTEPAVNPRYMEALAEELGVPVLPLTPIGSLTPQQKASDSDYFDLMLQNLDSLKKGLGGQ